MTDEKKAADADTSVEDNEQQAQTEAKSGPSKLPDFKEAIGMAGKFITDVGQSASNSVKEIIADYKARRDAEPKSSATAQDESSDKKDT